MGSRVVTAGIWVRRGREDICVMDLMEIEMHNLPPSAVLLDIREHPTAAQCFMV